VLTDNNFKWFNRMSTVQGSQDAINKAQPVQNSISMILACYCCCCCCKSTNLGLVSVVPMRVDSRSIVEFGCRSTGHGRYNSSRSAKYIFPNKSR